MYSIEYNIVEWVPVLALYKGDKSVMNNVAYDTQAAKDLLLLYQNYIAYHQRVWGLTWQSEITNSILYLNKHFDEYGEKWSTSESRRIS